MAQLFHSIHALQQRLSEAGIPSVVIGGVAIATWGDPRVTRDVDLKVLLWREDANRLLTLLLPDYTPLHPEPYLALQKQAMLFVQDRAGVRIDLLLAETSYDIEAISRGREVQTADGITIRVCSPEDAIIYKMISTRPRDHEDARGVVQRQGDRLDDRYVLHWLQQFEAAFEDSTLIAQFREWRQRYK